jgi:hypothetical protein
MNKTSHCAKTDAKLVVKYHNLKPREIVCNDEDDDDDSG